MTQFDVYRNPNRSAAEFPYLLDVQSDLIGRLSTRVVVPMAHATAFKAAQHLNPVFDFEGQDLIMSTSDLAAIPQAALGERVGSLESRRHEILAAIDFLITGV